MILLGTLVIPAKKYEQIEVSLGLLSRVGPKMPLPVGELGLSNTLFLGPTKVSPKRRLDRINRFARLAAVPNRQVHADIMDDGTSLHLYSS